MQTDERAAPASLRTLNGPINEPEVGGSARSEMKREPRRQRAVRADQKEKPRPQAFMQVLHSRIEGRPMLC